MPLVCARNTGSRGCKARLGQVYLSCGTRAQVGEGRPGGASGPCKHAPTPVPLQGPRALLPDLSLRVSELLTRPPLGYQGARTAVLRRDPRVEMRFSDWQLPGAACAPRLGAPVAG